jgi:hypothetical protein
VDGEEECQPMLHSMLPTLANRSLNWTERKAG